MMTGPNAQRLLARILRTARVVTPGGAPHLLIEADADLLQALAAFDAELELSPAAVEAVIAGGSSVGPPAARCADPRHWAGGGLLDREHDDADEEPSLKWGTP